VHVRKPVQGHTFARIVPPCEPLDSAAAVDHEPQLWCCGPSLVMCCRTKLLDECPTGGKMHYKPGEESDHAVQEDGVKSQ